VIIPEVVLIQLTSWGWAHSCSKHVEDSNKHIIEEIVRQVGYLPEFSSDILPMTGITVRRYANELVTIFQLATLYCIVWNETTGWLWLTYQSKMPKSVHGLLQYTYSNNEAWQAAVQKGTKKGLRICQNSNCVSVVSLFCSDWSFSISILEHSATLYFATQCINP